MSYCLPEFVAKVERYYSQKIEIFGATPKGVDWGSAESQQLRFEQLLKIIPPGSFFTINDIGCGYGDLYRYLSDLKLDFDYRGFDISALMIKEANSLYGDRSNARFLNIPGPEKMADYSVASGVFNVRLDIADEPWQNYVIQTVSMMSAKSKLGFSFNCLTKYSDSHLKKSYLYYADPLSLFDFCKKTLARKVALLHDYDLWEFTVLVRKQA